MNASMQRAKSQLVKVGPEVIGNKRFVHSCTRLNTGPTDADIYMICAGELGPEVWQ